MAISTYQTYLMKKASGETAFSKLIDIKEFPDLGGAPEQLDTTTLSDASTTSINGIQQVDAMEFTCNYTKEDYEALLDLKDQDVEYAVWLGADATTKAPDGHNGKWSFTGQLSVFLVGNDVNQVQDMQVTINPSTEITYSAE